MLQNVSNIYIPFWLNLHDLSGSYKPNNDYIYIPFWLNLHIQAFLIQPNKNT